MWLSSQSVQYDQVIITLQVGVMFYIAGSFHFKLSLISYLLSEKLVLCGYKDTFSMAPW